MKKNVMNANLAHDCLFIKKTLMLMRKEINVDEWKCYAQMNKMIRCVICSVDLWYAHNHTVIDKTQDISDTYIIKVHYNKFLLPAHNLKNC